MFEDHAFEQGLDDLLFFGCELCDGFELEPKISIRATLIGPKINTSALTCRATASRRITSRMSCTRYTFGNPLRYVDPDGHDPCCQEQEDTKRRVATGAVTGAIVGGVVGGIVYGVPAAAGGAGVGTLVAPGIGTIAGGVAGGGGGAAMGAAHGAAVGALVGGFMGYVYDRIVGPSPQPAPGPAPPPQSTPATPPQSQSQPLPPPPAVMSKGGRQNKKDSGLRDKSDKEISKGARDRSLPKADRQKYMTEEKERGQRIKRKRLDNK